jgi:large repetitive protein
MARPRLQESGGASPSVVFSRGYYTRAVIAAFDFGGKNLTNRWVFDSNAKGNSAYAGEGNHNMPVADVDGDRKDEIVFGVRQPQPGRDHA